MDKQEKIKECMGRVSSIDTTNSSQDWIRNEIINGDINLAVAYKLGMQDNHDAQINEKFYEAEFVHADNVNELVYCLRHYPMVTPIRIVNALERYDKSIKELNSLYTAEPSSPKIIEKIDNLKEIIKKTSQIVKEKNDALVEEIDALREIIKKSSTAPSKEIISSQHSGLTDDKFMVFGPKEKPLKERLDKLSNKVRNRWEKFEKHEENSPVRVFEYQDAHVYAFIQANHEEEALIILERKLADEDVNVTLKPEVSDLMDITAKKPGIIEFIKI